MLDLLLTKNELKILMKDIEMKEVDVSYAGLLYHNNNIYEAIMLNEVYIGLVKEHKPADNIISYLNIKPKNYKLTKPDLIKYISSVKR